MTVFLGNAFRWLWAYTACLDLWWSHERLFRDPLALPQAVAEDIPPRRVPSQRPIRVAAQTRGGQNAPVKSSESEHRRISTNL